MLGGRSAETRAPWSRATLLHRGYTDFPRFDLRLLFHPSRPSSASPPTPPPQPHPRLVPLPAPPLPTVYQLAQAGQRPAGPHPPLPNSHCRGYTLLWGEVRERRAGGASPSSSWRSRRRPQLSFITPSSTCPSHLDQAAPSGSSPVSHICKHFTHFEL